MVHLSSLSITTLHPAFSHLRPRQRAENAVDRLAEDCGARLRNDDGGIREDCSKSEWLISPSYRHLIGLWDGLGEADLSRQYLKNTAYRLDYAVNQ